MDCAAKTLDSTMKPHILTAIPENTKEQIIGTHDGTFHADEVLACVILKMTNQFSSAIIVRSRNQDILSSCNVVVDVGGVYNHEKKLYDHHQRGFDECMTSLKLGITSSIKLSSAGLVYAHYGKDAIRHALNVSDEEMIETIWTKLYENFVQEIDAIDNGIDVAINYRYKINTHLSNRVGNCNSQWNEGDLLNGSERFCNAYTLVRNEFLGHMNNYANSWWPAREIVRDAMMKRNKSHPEFSEILELQFCPWASHLFDIEESMGLKGKIKYVIFQDQDRSSWRVRAVPSSPASFGLRLPLPKAWQGLRDDELSSKSGIPNCIFVHISGFIGGNSTKEGALEMARKAIAMSHRPV